MVNLGPMTLWQDVGGGGGGGPSNSEWKQLYWERYQREADAMGVPAEDRLTENSFKSKMPSSGDFDPYIQSIMGTHEQQLRTDKEVGGLKDSGRAALDTLKGTTRKSQEEYLGKFKSDRASRLAELTKLLQGQSDVAMSESNPVIMEDLNSRGLLKSSELGNSLARERGRLDREVNDRISLQSLADLDIEQSLAKGIIDTEFQLDTQGMNRINALDESAVGRNFSLADLDQQTRGTLDIARMEAEAQAKANETALLSAGIKGITGAATFGLSNSLPSLADPTTRTTMPASNRRLNLRNIGD